jgi:hypothetical protein
MVTDKEAVEKGVPMILSLAKDEGRQMSLRNNIGKYKMVDADEKIAEEILNSI